MTMTAADVLSQAAALLQDRHGLYFPDLNLLPFLNDGQRAVCNLRPDACSETRTVTLATGYRQTLPADAVGLLRVVRNAAGKAVPLVTEAELIALRPRVQSVTLAAGAKQTLPAGASALLDVPGLPRADMAAWTAYQPGWTGAAAGTPVNWMYRPQEDPRTFWVYPPAPSSPAATLTLHFRGTQWRADTATAEIEFYLYNEAVPLQFEVYPAVAASPAQTADIQVRLNPADCATTAAALSIVEAYAPALIDYIVYRGCASDPTLKAEAGAWLERFRLALAAKTQADAAASPRVQRAAETVGEGAANE